MVLCHFDMQPGCAIPPFDKDEVQRLVGMTVKVPQVTHKDLGVKRWAKIVKVQFIHAESVILWLEYPHASRIVRTVEQLNSLKVRFQNHSDDPLRCAIHKARAAADTIRKTSATPLASAPSPGYTGQALAR